MQAMTEFQASLIARASADIAGYLSGMLVDLYKTPITVNPSVPLATFTAAIADFTGYTQGVVTWDAPSLDLAGNVEVVGHAIVFRSTGTTVGNMIYGCFCTAAIGGALLFAGPCDNAPIPILSTLNQLVLQIVYRPGTNSFTITIV